MANWWFDLRGLLLILSAVAATATRADYAVQVGAYGRSVNAERAAAALRANGFSVHMRQYETASGRMLTLIRIGPYSSREEAQAALARLKERAFSGYVVTEIVPPSLSREDGGEDAPAPPSIPAAPATPAQAAPASSPDSAPESPLPPTLPDPPSSAEAAAAGEDFLVPLVSDEDAPPLAGFFQSELAYTWPKPDHFSLFRNTLDMHLGGRWGSAAQWHLGGRASYDAVFDLTDFYPKAVERDEGFQARVWETYVDFSAGSLDFRVGRQQIIWGEMVGLFFADVVSAKDMRQFVLPDFDMIRIPQWALRSEWFHGDYHAELIWIPYPTYDESGVPGSDFYTGPQSPPSGYAQVILGERRPAGSIEQSGYGLRFSALKAGWDMAAFYYGSMDAQPTYFRQLSIVNGTPTLIYTPDHRRIDQLGATLSKDFAPVVVRAEAVYTHGDDFPVTRLDDPDGVVQQDFFDYAVGVDYEGLAQTRLNVQLFQRWFPEHDPDIGYEALESGVTLFAGTTVMEGRIEPQLLVMTGLNRGDWLARPHLIWHAGPHWRWTVGVDLFGGSRQGLFGRYDGDDRVYGELRYSF